LFSSLLESWQACEDLLAQGKVRSIGVSNLSVADLDWLAERSETVPAVNQVELHPSFQQVDLRQYHNSRGIITEAWGPLALGESLKDPALQTLAKKYGKTPAQLILRWHIQLGNIVLAKSTTPSRIRENLEIFDFRIDADDMERIATLEGDPHGAPSRTMHASLPRW
jgi:2,5-diketo-D-gluconate reductase A